MNTILNYLKEEHREKRKCELDSDNWTLSQADDLPFQENGYDCGVFMLKNAQCLARGEPFNFCDDDMDFFRRRLVWEIVRNNLMWP